jgi:hypothetical protein
MDNGFVNFPILSNQITEVIGKTLIYIIAFDLDNINCYPNTHIFLKGTFVCDDVIQRNNINSNMSIDDLVKGQIKNNNIDTIYFPNINSTHNENLSIPLSSSVLIGWSDKTYELRNDIGFWYATFNDLTIDGKRLYYGIKKLHNDKEVRILTFNGI